eukprot:Skav229401  [mRNA]  locus=scaffold2316:118054:126285:+ [translate_table: standard]
MTGHSAELGPVALVGAGPGDPELLTLRALRKLEAADVVLHDSLIPEEVLNFVPKTAKLINVGKRCGDVKDRGLQQQEIHELMLVNSRRGCKVVRLKCGDPFIFGRGGEELEFLAEHKAGAFDPQGLQHQPPAFLRRAKQSQELARLGLG